MEKIILFLQALMCLSTTCYGVELSLEALPRSRVFCGALNCAEVTSPKPAPNLPQDGFSQGKISGMMIFKTIAVTPGVKGQSTQSVLMASLSEEQPKVTSVSEAMKVFGRLEAKRATLRVELAKDEDCSAEFTCLVKVADSQGRVLISTSRLLQQASPGESETVSGERPGSDSTQLLLQQMSHKMMSMEKLMRDQEKNIDNKMMLLNKKLSSLDDAFRMKQGADTKTTFDERVLFLDRGLQNDTDVSTSCMHALRGVESWLSEVRDCVETDVGRSSASKETINVENAASLTPFQLTYSPARVVKHVTSNVTVLCAHQAKIPSQLAQISRIRIVKKSSTGWQLLAEHRDLSPEPQASLDVSASARISRQVEDTFLQVTWPVANVETFGTYRCEVIGFQRETLGLWMELTSEMVIKEEEISARDMFKQTEEKLADVADATNKLKENMNTVDEKLESFRNVLSEQDEKVSVLSREIISSRQAFVGVSGEISNLTKVVNSLFKEIHLVSGRIDKLEDKVGTHRDEITELQLSNATNKLKENMNTVGEKLESFQNVLNEQDKKMAVLGREITEIGSVNETMESVVKEITSLKLKDAALSQDLSTVNRSQVTLNNKLTSIFREISDFQNLTNNRFHQILRWPDGYFALLKPKHGCPVDLTFFHGSDKYFKIHTESSRIKTSENAFSSVLPPDTISRVDSQNFFTLWFCESSGLSGDGLWPNGNYCINKLNTSDCPNRFSQAYVDLDTEDTGARFDHTTRILSDRRKMHFCCMTSGRPDTPIVLPTSSPFVLYRRGGQCQAVQGMNVRTETISIDTEDNGNIDSASSGGPDIVLNKRDPLMFYLCFYTKA